MANYEPTITEADVAMALQGAGLRFKDSGRYWVSQCPLHEDQVASAQIFKDDFFVNCLAGCGRFHITKPFPELRTNDLRTALPTTSPRRPKIEAQHQYQTFDLMEEWSRLPLIPRDHTFKHLPLETLDELGWRYDEAKDSYFIPYFNQSRDAIPFAQWRHLSGERRFTFLAGAKPTLYGKWNIGAGERLFIVEGTSDAAVLERCAVPWIACPSASSGGLLGRFAGEVQRLQISLVYAGDRDEAGDRLKAVLDDSKVAYRVCQPPEPFKDWGDFYEAKGATAVFNWCKPKLFE